MRKNSRVTVWLKNGQKIKLRVRTLDINAINANGDISKLNWQQRVWVGTLLHYVRPSDIVAITRRHTFYG